MKKIIRVLSVALALIIPSHVDSAEVDLYEEICEEIGSQYDCCPEVLEAMIFYESAGNPKAISKCGAVGLLQLRPETNKERLDLLCVDDLTDPYQNILAGADHLMDLSKRYEIYEALVAYNCGEYSKELKEVMDGGSNAYADKILEMSADLERKHGK